MRETTDIERLRLVKNPESRLIFDFGLDGIPFVVTWRLAREITAVIKKKNDKGLFQPAPIKLDVAFQACWFQVSRSERRMMCLSKGPIGIEAYFEKSERNERKLILSNIQIRALQKQMEYFINEMESLGDLDED